MVTVHFTALLSFWISSNFPRSAPTCPLSLHNSSKFILFLQLHLTQEGQGWLFLCHKDKTSFEFLFAGTCTGNKQHRLSIQDRSIVFPMVYRPGWHREQTNVSWLWLSCLYSIFKVADRSWRNMCEVFQSCLTHSRVIPTPTLISTPPPPIQSPFADYKADPENLKIFCSVHEQCHLGDRNVIQIVIAFLLLLGLLKPLASLKYPGSIRTPFSLIIPSLFSKFSLDDHQNPKVAKKKKKQ